LSESFHHLFRATTANFRGKAFIWTGGKLVQPELDQEVLLLIMSAAVIN